MIYSVPRWLLLGNNGAGWLPNVSLIANDMPHRLEERVIAHEAVHQLQQDELGYIKWVLKYLKFHWDFGYSHNPLEVDARKWDRDTEQRPSRAWENYVPKKQG